MFDQDAGEKLMAAELLVKAILHNDLALAWKLANDYKNDWEVKL